MEHIGRSSLKVYLDVSPTPLLWIILGKQFHFDLGKKVKISRFAIKVVELIGDKHMTISAYK